MAKKKTFEIALKEVESIVKDMESGDYYYENLKTSKTQWEIPKCFMEKVWMRHFDATSGDYYYENLKTSVTSWNCPPNVQFD